MINTVRTWTRKPSQAFAATNQAELKAGEGSRSQTARRFLPELLPDVGDAGPIWSSETSTATLK